MKGCNLTARFGRIRFDTQTIDIDDVMLRLHRGDFTDLNLRGKLLGMTGLTPSGLNDSSQVLNLVTMSEMVIAAVNMERTLNQWIWQGSFAIANQFPGLDVQIATGQVDADTNATCPALDSDVKNFGYDLVCGNGRDIPWWARSPPATGSPSSANGGFGGIHDKLLRALEATART